MAIQNRRGDYANFDPQKMKPGEFAIVQSNDPNASDGKAVYICTQAGTVKRLVSSLELYDEVQNAATEIAQEIHEAVDEDVQRAEDAAESAEQSAASLEIDGTLSFNNRAADAKTVGAMLGKISDLSIGEIDKSSSTKISAYIYPSTNKVVTKDDCKTLYFACLPNTTYIINKSLSARFRVAYVKEVPVNDTTIFNCIQANNSTSISITTGEDALYVVVYYYDGTNDTDTESTIYNSITIKYINGTTAIDSIARNTKVDKQQSVLDAGKVMIIGDDGILVPTEIAAGLSDEAKEALLDCFAHVAWIDEHGQNYYDALEEALYPDVYPKITAVFDAGINVIYTDDALNTLKQYLTVTYYETEESSGVAVSSTDYTLSGVLSEGDNIVGVNYNGMTTSFMVPDVVDFYNIWRWEWNNSGGNMQKVSAGINSDQSDTTMYPSKTNIDMSASLRRTMCVTKGLAPFYVQNQTAVASDYYPIPVPKEANYVNIAIEPAGMYIFMVIHELNESMQYNPRVNREQWRQIPSGGWGRGITQSTNNRNTFLGMNIKYNESGSAFATEPTSIVIEFSEV